MTGAAIVWFRRDLRLADNPAIAAAVGEGRPIIPVFVWDGEADDRAPGAAARWWLWHSLRALDADLGRRGSRLVLLRGPAAAALARLAHACDAVRLHTSLTLDPGEPAAADLQHDLAAAGARLTVEAHGPNLLFGPPFPLTADGRPYRVFTPFWRACRSSDPPPAPRPSPSHLPAPASWPRALEIAALRDEAVRPWSAGFLPVWQPGEAGAHDRLARFIQDALCTYHTDRDRPDLPGTSRLSPHLHFGEISARTVWYGVSEAMKACDTTDAFQRQLAWREFAHQLLQAHPETTAAPLRAEFAAFPWLDDPRALALWQRGLTGYPLVDAGMRELRHTGWMHNRARLVCASLLCKHLLVRWQEGARWFRDTLLDADLADNTLGWQWVAGSGADAAPYFRVFNPVTQGRRFDPRGSYVRRWVPELTGLPDKWIHAPWEAPAAVRAAAGVRLTAVGGPPAPFPEPPSPSPGQPSPSPGQPASRNRIEHCYPEPIIEPAPGRERALAAFRNMKDGA